MSNNKPDKPRKQRTEIDPTIKAMRDLDRIFSTLNEKQMGVLFSWVAMKYPDNKLGKLITT